MGILPLLTPELSWWVVCFLVDLYEALLHLLPLALLQLFFRFNLWKITLQDRLLQLAKNEGSAKGSFNYKS